MFLVGFLAIICTPFVAAGYVYQEDATAYYNDTLWTGGNLANAYDGDWDTYATGNGANNTLYINYTLPVGYTTSSLIHIKSGSINSNRTMSAWCFNWTTTTVQIRVKSNYQGTLYQNEWKCASNRPGYGGWETIYSGSSSSPTYQYIYEEAMWWDVTDTTYPIFSSPEDNTGTLTDTGTGNFNITIANTNGSVVLEINGENVTATNSTPSLFSATYDFSSGGTYPYRWYALGNGSSNLENISDTYNYVVLYSDTVYPIFFDESDNSFDLSYNGTGLFNISINNTNGTVYFEIDGANVTATNTTPNLFNASHYFDAPGTYYYRWYALGNGTDNLLNSSELYSYTVGADYVVTYGWCYQETANVSTVCGGLDTGAYFNTTNNHTTYSYCYQESVDNATDCGGLDTGNIAYISGDEDNWIDAANLFDGDWDTYAQAKRNDSLSATIYITYMKPENASIYGNQWAFRYNVTVATIVYGKIPSSCLTYYGDRLVVRIQHLFLTNQTRIHCQSGASNFDSITGVPIFNSPNDINVRLYEEAMFWNMTDTLSSEIYNVIYVNYTKPANATSNSLYMVKMNNLTTNNTIPSSCWDYDANKLMFRFISENNDTFVDYASGSYLECFNGTWKQMRSYTVGASIIGMTYDTNWYNFIDGNWNTFIRGSDGLWNSTIEEYTQQNLYEEAMWWNVTQAVVDYGENNTLVDDCSAYTIPFINFTTFNENYYDEKLENYLEVYLVYGVNNSYNKTYAANFSGDNSYQLCFSSIEPGINYSVYAKSTTTGFTHRYYLNNYTYDGTVVYADIGNYNSSLYISRLDIYVKDPSTYYAISNVYAVLQRFYVAEGVWRNVQWDKADEFGLLTYNVREQDTDYRIVFYDENFNYLRTTTSLKFSCVSYYCNVVYLLDRTTATGPTQDLRVTYYFNNNTGLLGINWTDTTALTKSIRILVTRMNGLQTEVLCNNTQYGSSGATFCDLSAYNGTFKVTVYDTASPEKITFSAIIEWVKDFKLWNFIGNKEGLIYTFAVVLTCAGAGLISPVTVVITTVAGLFFAVLLGFTSFFTTTIIIAVAIFAVIISLRLRV